MPSSALHEVTIAGLCCSAEKSLYMLDGGRARVYCLDIETKDCFSFGAGYLDGAVDITTFGMFVLVVTKNSIVLFSPDGKFLRRFFFQFSSAPKAVCIADSTVLVTGEAAEIFRFHLEIE